MEWGSAITYLGGTSLKNRRVTFGVKDRDRVQQTCVAGKSEEARAAFLTGMALQDVARHQGIVVLDLSGQLSEMFVERLPTDACDRLIFLNPANAEYPFSWNVVKEFRELPEQDGLHLFTRMLQSVYKIPNDPVVEAAAEAILKGESGTMLSFYELLAENKHSDSKQKAGNESDFYALRDEAPDIVSAVLDNGRYIAKDTMVRNLLGQPDSKFSLSTLSEGGLVVVDLSEIKVFPTRVTPIVKAFLFASLARADSLQTPIGLFLFDCLRYLSEDDLDLFFGSRELAITASDAPYTEEDKKLHEHALSRSGSIVSFAPAQTDAPLLERMFYPYVAAEELTGLGESEFVIMLSIDAIRSRPFFARALPLPERKSVSCPDLLTESRAKYTMPRRQVDELFRKKPAPEGEEEKDDSGSFSDAFRSIFAKRAAPSKEPAKTESAGLKPPSPVASPKPSAKTVQSADTKKPSEVPEDVLKGMLHVD